jgi:hypothetical protein
MRTANTEHTPVSNSQANAIKAKAYDSKEVKPELVTRRKEGQSQQQ